MVVPNVTRSRGRRGSPDTTFERIVASVARTRPARAPHGTSGWRGHRTNVDGPTAVISLCMATANGRSFCRSHTNGRFVAHATLDFDGETGYAEHLSSLSDGMTLVSARETLSGVRPAFSSRCRGVHEAQGVEFLRQLKQAFARGATRSAWLDELLQRLDAIEPGFGAWAAMMR